MTELSKKIVNVRKKRNGQLHRCHGCLRLIPPGTKVEVSTYADSSDGLWKIYTCLPCVNYVEEFYEEIVDPYDCCYSEGAVSESLNYYYYTEDSTRYDEELYWRKIKYFGYGDEKWK